MNDISALDYFAAHAPDHPQPWFQPVMPTPEPDVFAYKGAARTKEEIAQREAEALTWRLERDKQRWVQWPYAWAQQMIAQRQENEAARSSVY
jgi:hypothetical protein